MAHWWGDARLDKTHGRQMKGMMTPHEAPLMSQWWVFAGSILSAAGCRQLFPGGEAGFLQHAADMGLHGPGGDEKAMGDVSVAEPGVDKSQNLCLASGDPESGQVRWDN